MALAALGRASRLRALTLNLWGNKVGAAGAAALAGPLRALDTFALDLRNNGPD